MSGYIYETNQYRYLRTSYSRTGTRGSLNSTANNSPVLQIVQTEETREKKAGEDTAGNNRIERRQREHAEEGKMSQKRLLLLFIVGFIFLQRA